MVATNPFAFVGASLFGGVVCATFRQENVMLDSQGYLKLVDFGLAKDLMDGSKTFTVVGTASRLTGSFNL